MGYFEDVVSDLKGLGKGKLFLFALVVVIGVAYMGWVATYAQAVVAGSDTEMAVEFVKQVRNGSVVCFNATTMLHNVTFSWVNKT